MKLALLLTVATLLAASIAAQLSEMYPLLIASALTLGLQIAAIVRLLALPNEPT